MPKPKRKILAIDSETDPFLYGRAPKPFVWGLFDGEFYTEFWGDDCSEKLIEYLLTEEPSIIYAHNGGKFDFFFLLSHLDSDVKIINGRIAKATLFDGLHELRDSFLILPLPLSAHDKDTIDYAKMERDVRHLHKDEISKYLNKDCRSLWEWVSNFINNFGNGLTLAGSAFKQLKKTDYPNQATGLAFDNVFRPFYQGGRVQCFDVGAFVGEYQYVDINSAYPYAMKFPHWVGADYRETLRLPDRENGSYYVKLTAISKGALPYKSDGKTYYPDDDQEREYYVSGWEIQAALRTDTIKIKKIIRVYLPLFTSDFSEYVDKFFAMKLEAEHRGDKTTRQFAKLMLNSCYGKFGQDGREFEAYQLMEYGDVPDPYIDKSGKLNRWECYSETAGLLSIFSRPDPVERFYNVATAASVTGFVRAYLWEHIHKSEGVLYCDTDSIICKKFGGEISEDLGAWDLEAELTEAYIAQRKMYAVKLKDGSTKVASKGVRLNYDQIRNGVLTGENINYAKEAPAFSLKFGVRFQEREIDFKNLAKNACNNPADSHNKRASKKAAKTITYSLREILCHK